MGWCIRCSSTQNQLFHLLAIRLLTTGPHMTKLGSHFTQGNLSVTAMGQHLAKASPQRRVKTAIRWLWMTSIWQGLYFRYPITIVVGCLADPETKQKSLCVSQKL